MKKLALILSLVLIVLALAACSSAKPAENNTNEPVVNKPADNTENKTEEREALELNDGTFTGTGKGFKSDIEVEVVIEAGEITVINILAQNESEGIADPAFDEVPKAIIEAQATDVDAATGATSTSKGIVAAVEDALSKAQK
jgi:uncharacterized protein with FMN-binding domain